MVVFTGKLVVPRELLPPSFMGAAMDRGGTMTKVALVRNRDEQQVTIEFYAFSNNAFDEALQFVKDNADLRVSEDIMLPATGIGTTRYQKAVQEKLGLAGMTLYNEFTSQVHGLAFLANNYDHSQFCCALDETQLAARGLEALKLDAESSLLYQVRQLQKTLISAKVNTIRQMKAAIAMASPEPVISQCKSFPALLAVGGSAFPVVIMDDETLTTIFLSGINVGGKTFLAFSHLFLETTNYEEIIELAKEGKRVAAAKGLEKQQDLPNDKYEQLNKSLETHSYVETIANTTTRSEKAFALIEYFTALIADGLRASIAQTGITTVYFTGGFFLSDFILNELAWRLRASLPDVQLNLHFLQNTSAGLIGTIMCSDALQKDVDKTNERFMKIMAAQHGPPPAAANETN